MRMKIHKCLIYKLFFSLSINLVLILLHIYIFIVFILIVVNDVFFVFNLPYNLQLFL